MKCKKQGMEMLNRNKFQIDNILLQIFVLALEWLDQ